MRIDNSHAFPTADILQDRVFHHGSFTISRATDNVDVSFTFGGCQANRGVATVVFVYAKNHIKLRTVLECGYCWQGFA